MNIHDFLKSPAETTRHNAPHDRIVMSSRVRLARNLRGAPYPGWAKKIDRVKVARTDPPRRGIPAPTARSLF